MRRLGVIPYMTPLQRATEASAMPKSVMKTTVGGGCTADCCARTGLTARSKKAAVATHHKQNIRADFPAGVNIVRIKLNSPKGVLVYCAIVALPASIIGAAIKSIGKNQW